MALVRAFVAAELPAQIQDALERISIRLQRELRGLPLRWIKIENIHLTLKFLGDTPETGLKSISEVLAEETQKLPRLEIQLNGLGVFPNLRHPNVVWAGVEVPVALVEFQRQLEINLESLGYPSERRPFSPHLTLARVQRGASSVELKQIGDHLSEARTENINGVVDSIALFRSDLRPDGAVYHSIFRSRLVNSI